MKAINRKRESLERFIKEQTLGPGANGYRIVDLQDDYTVAKPLNDSVGLDYTNEILDTVPAVLYSTGILFPEDKSDSAELGAKSGLSEKVDIDEGDDEGPTREVTEDDVESTEGIELNQMYPRTMGLSYCLDEGFMNDGHGNLEFKVSFRHYTRVVPVDWHSFSNRYGVLCQTDPIKLREFIDKHKLLAFSIREVQGNHFLMMNRLSREELIVLNEELKEISNELSELLKTRCLEIKEISALRRGSRGLAGLLKEVYSELKSRCFDEVERRSLYFVTQQIESIENILEHLRNAISVCHGHYGLWQSKRVLLTVRMRNATLIPGERKKSYLYTGRTVDSNITVINEAGDEKEGLSHIYHFDLGEDGYASISANVQLSRDTRRNNRKVYVKLQLVNTSSGFVQSLDSNRFYSVSNEDVNAKCFFGVKVSVEDKYLTPYSEQEYPAADGDVPFPEDTTTRFLYDQFKDYAIGHGCSVSWNISGETIRVETEYIPQCETPDIDTVPRDKEGTWVYADKCYEPPLMLGNTDKQAFKWLSTFSEASDDEVVDGLKRFVGRYGEWIEEKRRNPRYTGANTELAKQELDKCQQDFERMRGNIECFLEGPSSKTRLAAFRLMNSAMFMQLWHSQKVKDDKVKGFMDSKSVTVFNFDFYKDKADDKLFSTTESAGWRAFQLAFILLNLDGIFKLDDDDKWVKRNEWVDLVWFPTGGGKTEAYLGLIALTIINRRWEHNVMGGGTAAIMRYTLRLLTQQQFQRASLVIMALELIRRWGGYNLGQEPITIGLWIGKDSLPNTNKELIIEYTQKLNQGLENKIPLSSCPWCNSPIEGAASIDHETRSDVFHKGRVHLKCKNIKCPFSFGLGRDRDRRADQGPIPVSLSDETIYLHPPTLLFATVDKFAQLAHNVNPGNDGRAKDSRRIFGKGNWEVDRSLPASGYIPPDLIIQDELHLLLGPLGSAVALFESAVDQLCTREDGTRPKVISSTATTRNTPLQIAALFDRKVNLFPKPGVECDDSFFAFYRRVSNHEDASEPIYLSKRKYMGLLPTGRTQIWMQMRLAAVLMVHRAIFELDELGDKHPIDFDSYNDFEKAMDHYHTTISYFNSLREVAKTQSQVQTYILKELRKVFSRTVRPGKLMQCIYTYGPILDSELTGRLSGTEVKNELKKVESKWVSNERLAFQKNGSSNVGRTPPDFIVATNMISVGIDVSRFNTIIMNSMPRNTAEYIQASSRVARNDKGLVLTVHHPFRARDISHYEKFIEFHRKMYSHVEPISITPFTRKAVGRYMALYLATILRHKTKYSSRESAREISDVNDVELEQLIESLVKNFETRKEKLTEYEITIRNILIDSDLAHISRWITEAIEDWKCRSDDAKENQKDLVFNRVAPNARRPQVQLYVDIDEYEENIHSDKWKIPMSLRVIEPEAAIYIKPI
jgi:hypothetical protein